jgi:hypothetical protein
LIAFDGDNRDLDQLTCGQLSNDGFTGAACDDQRDASEAAWTPGLPEQVRRWQLSGKHGALSGTAVRRRMN